jgi:hypothetical protein
MDLTREYLNNLYVEQQELDRQAAIDKIVNHFKHSIINKAKMGETIYSENFSYKIFLLKDVIIEKLKSIFPDSEIMVTNKQLDLLKCINISIDWTL